VTLTLIECHQLAAQACRERYEQLKQIPGADADAVALRYWEAMCRLQNFEKEVLRAMARHFDINVP
jgi:hypothetical protein